MFFNLLTTVARHEKKKIFIFLDSFLIHFREIHKLTHLNFRLSVLFSFVFFHQFVLTISDVYLVT